MALLTLESSGTQTATIGTEHTLATSTNNGAFTFEADLTNLASGEIIELRVKGITLSGGATGLMWKYNATAPLIEVRVACPPVASDISITATLKQVTGTGRSFAWKLLRAG